MYNCEYCVYETNVKFCFEKHNTSKKHLKKVEAKTEKVEVEIEKVEVEIEKVEVEIEKVEVEIEKVEVEPIISIMKAYDAVYDLKYKHYDLYHYVYKLRKMQRDLTHRYIDYDLKRNYWKPLKSKCIIQMVQYIKQKREDKWSNNNKGISMEHSFRIYCIKQSHLMTDIRNYYGYPKM
jgi:septal ring factor EnvC (AmiA/AmiB activator)